MRLIYCADGNRRFAEIAIAAGFEYGARLPARGLHFPIVFADQDYHNPDRNVYVREVASQQPEMATVIDWEAHVSRDTVLGWAEDIAPYVRQILIIPKIAGRIHTLPRRIGGRQVILGYSLPTTYGAAGVPAWEFRGWPVHLLGGSPQAQWRLSHYMDVVSLDGNMHHMMATRYCAYWDHKRQTSRGWWPSLLDADGQKWGDGSSDADAPYEAFERSCQNIMAFWKNILGPRRQPKPLPHHVLGEINH